MRNRRVKKTRLLGLALAACLCSATGVFAWNSEVARADASPITELFTTSGITLDAMQMDTELLYEEQALRLTSFDVEETIEWKQDVSGTFSFDYMPVTLNGNDTARTFVTQFTDISDGDTFKVVIEHGSTIEVSVEFNGVKAGIFYYAQAQKRLTQVANSSGDYTQFSANKIRVTFDPETMTVSASDADRVQLMVWSMLQSENDGREVGQTLKPFDAYRVAFGITKFLDESGAVLLYSVNDYDMSGLLLNGSGTPAIYADYQRNALKGEEYVLPEATAYDIADGNIKPSRTLYNPKGEDVKLAENATSFIPTTTGKYTVVYTAKNSKGTTSEKKYALQVYNSIPESDYELDWNLNAEYVVGEKVTFPVCTLSGGLIRYGEEKGTLTVKRNGATLRAYKNIVSGVSYTFRTAGEYEVIYALGGGREEAYELTVIEGDNRFVTDGVAATYQKGDVVDCSSAYVLVGGEKVPYEFSVEYPNGRKYKNKIFKADLSGVYHLRATASVAGKDCTLEKQITVAVTKNDTFKTISEHVNISTGRSILTGQSGAVISATQSGVLVEYSKPVELSTFSGQTEKHKTLGTTQVKNGATPVIDFTVDPVSYGTAAAGGVYVYITDAADPNNKITISIMADGSPTWSYIRAGAPGQDLTGYHVSTSGKSNLDNTPGTLYSGKVGFITYHSFKGQLTGTATGANSKITLYYDNDTKQVLSTPKIGNTYKSYVVTDLDNVDYTLGNAWQGFTSDKVYISFMVMGLVAPQANMVVYNVAGEDFSNATISKDELPTVNVEGEDTLTGLKGSSLVLPAATAYDALGEVIDNVVCKVYYKKDGVRYDVPVSNGRFDTTRSGDYEIEYTAIDVFGNRGTRCVKVNVLGSAADLKTGFGEMLEQDYDYTQCLAGSYVRLFAVEDLSVENAIGDVTTVCTVYYGADDDRKAVELKNGKFFAERIGSYTVEFVTTDSVGRTTMSSYTVEVAKPVEPVIYGDIPYYVGFIRGNTYTISDLYFIDFAQSPDVQKASVYINGEAYTQSTFSLPDLTEKYEQESETSETVELEYRYGDKTLYRYPIPVRTVKKYQKPVEGRPSQTRFLSDRCFLFGEKLTGDVKSNHLLLSTMSDGALLEFVQPVSSNRTELSLSTNTDQDAAEGTANALPSNIRGVTLYLTDAMAVNKRLKVQILVAEDESLYMKIGNEISLPLSGSLTGLSWDTVQFRYENASKAFYDANTGLLIVKPTTYDNGEPFEGFSEQVYVALSMQREGAEDAGTLRLYSINGQSFSNTMKDDNVKPTVNVNGSLSGIYDIGTEFKTFTASASDVLSSIEEFYVSVTLERNGQTEIVNDLNGKPIEKMSPTQEYAFRLEKIGTYRIIYYAKDRSGMDVESVFVLTSVQRSAPTITLSGEVPETVKPNSTVELPTASVQFMEESESNLTYLIYITPSNCYETVENNSFVANEEGIYRVRYYALDAYGNYTMVEYQIVCVK